MFFYRKFDGHIAERALEQHHGEKLDDEEMVLEVSRWLMTFDNHDDPTNSTSDMFNSSRTKVKMSASNQWLSLQT